VTAGCVEQERRAPRADCSASVRRVLMTTDAVGGVWRYAIDLGRALLLRGVRTTIAVMGPVPSARQLQEVSRAGLDIAVRPCRLEWMPDPWDDVQHAGTWLLALERSIRPDIVHLNGYVHARCHGRHPSSS